MLECEYCLRIPCSSEQSYAHWLHEDERFYQHKKRACATARVHSRVCLLQTAPNRLSTEAWEPECDRMFFIGLQLQVEA